MDDRPVLLTGFEPYGGRGRNPAHEAMQALHDRVVGGRRVVGAGLPVSLDRMPGIAAAMLNDINPAIVISLGLWPGESLIRIERIAVNIADFEIADNEGVLAVDQEVLSGEPDALMSTLPLRAMEKAILDAGIPVKLSATAGTYLCNACLYSFLAAALQHHEPVVCGFIHVPYMPEQVAELLVKTRKQASIELHQRNDLASMSLGDTVRAVEIAIEAGCQALSGARTV